MINEYLIQKEYEITTNVQNFKTKLLNKSKSGNLIIIKFPST